MEGCDVAEMTHEVGEDGETIFLLGRPLPLPLLYALSDGGLGLCRSAKQYLLYVVPQCRRDERVGQLSEKELQRAVGNVGIVATKFQFRKRSAKSELLVSCRRLTQRVWGCVNWRPASSQGFSFLRPRP